MSAIPTKVVIRMQHQHQQRADAGRRQAGQDGQRVDVALVKNAQDDVERRSALRPNQVGLGLRATTGTPAPFP